MSEEAILPLSGSKPCCAGSPCQSPRRSQTHRSPTTYVCSHLEQSQTTGTPSPAAFAPVHKARLHAASVPVHLAECLLGTCPPSRSFSPDSGLHHGASFAAPPTFRHIPLEVRRPPGPVLGLPANFLHHFCPCLQITSNLGAAAGPSPGAMTLPGATCPKQGPWTSRGSPAGPLAVCELQ